MLPRGMKRTISIVGAGRVGRTLGKRLHKLGWRLGAVVTRSAGTSRIAVRTMGGGRPQSRLTRDIFAADVILLATPDTLLEGISASLARIGGKDCRGKVVLHTSGALDRSVLAPLAKCGASTGSLHPMQTFTGRAVPKLAGVTFAVEGDGRARRAAQQIARHLGGVPVTIDGPSKPAYHAAGALAAGHALALMEAATRILVEAGFARRRAIGVLLPLTRQMLDNFEKVGPRAAWTGPIARGDFTTVSKHARVLRRHPREFQEAYAALANLAAQVLSKNPAVTKQRLRRALKNSQGGNI